MGLFAVGHHELAIDEFLELIRMNPSWNEEAGRVWLERVLNHFPKVAWLNPVPQAQWGYTQSNAMIRQIFSDRMYPLTLDGIDQATRALLR